MVQRSETGAWRGPRTRNPCPGLGTGRGRGQLCLGPREVRETSNSHEAHQCLATSSNFTDDPNKCLLFVLLGKSEEGELSDGAPLTASKARGIAQYPLLSRPPGGAP